MELNQQNKSHPMMGLQLGQYRIEDVLGGGGMGVVFRAHQETVDRDVALKLLPPEMASDETNKLRLEREAKALAKLNHPNIVTTFDFGLTPSGQAYLILELVSGDSLKEVIDREFTLAPDRALRIFIQIAEAMRFAHEQGIVHRDLKPHNVMLSTIPCNDFVKVLDFGIAKLAQESQQLTQIGEVMGSPLYMSPEQCTGKPVDSRTDIYSMGVMMFQALTGKFPFQGINLSDTVHKKCRDPVPEFAVMAPDLKYPPGLEELVRSTLAVDPDKRYQTMAELKTELELLLQAITANPGSMFRPSYSPAASTLALPPAGSTSTLRDDGRAPSRSQIGGPYDTGYGGGNGSRAAHGATASDASRVTISTPLLVAIVGVVVFALTAGLFLGLNASGLFHITANESSQKPAAGSTATSSTTSAANTSPATSSRTSLESASELSKKFSSSATAADGGATAVQAKSKKTASRVPGSSKKTTASKTDASSLEKNDDSAAVQQASPDAHKSTEVIEPVAPPLAPPLAEQLKNVSESAAIEDPASARLNGPNLGPPAPHGQRRLRPRQLMRRVNRIERQTGKTKREALMDIIENHRNYNAR